MASMHRLQPTAWLAQRLGLSITTIERLRAQNSSDLPPHLTIGHSIRYDEMAVENWLRQRLQAQYPAASEGKQP